MMQFVTSQDKTSITPPEAGPQKGREKYHSISYRGLSLHPYNPPSASMKWPEKQKCRALNILFQISSLYI